MDTACRRMGGRASARYLNCRTALGLVALRLQRVYFLAQVLEFRVEGAELVLQGM